LTAVAREPRISPNDNHQHIWNTCHPRVESDAEAERIFSALSEGGEVFMPMEDTFFASRFGQLRDRFGLNWMILHERPMPPRR